MFWQVVRSWCSACCETEETSEEGDFLVGLDGHREVREAEGEGRRTELYGSFEEQRRLAQLVIRDSDHGTVGTP